MDYNSLIYQEKKEGGLKDLFFRLAGDGYIQMEIGSNQVFDLMDSFRLFKITEELEKRAPVEGLIEYGMGFRTLMLKYDPVVIDYMDLISILVDIDSKITSIEKSEFTVREISLPIVFEDEVTRNSIRYYINNIKRTPDYVIDDHNIAYVAKYNGISKDELKEKVTGTGWIIIHELFFPGGPFQLPLDPRSAIEAPKYNPSRTFTAEGTVGVGGKCLFIYTMNSPGGYQILGRTIPTWQYNQSHPDFKKNPFILYPKDIIRYRETSEDDVLSIYEQVSSGSDLFRYNFNRRKFRVSDWIKEYQNENVLDDLRKFQKGKENAKKKLLSEV